MTDAEKAERLARVLWWAYWGEEPPTTFDFAHARVQGRSERAARAALTWLDSLEDDAPDLIAERDALRAEVARLRGALQPFAGWLIGGKIADDPVNREKYPLLTQQILNARAALGDRDA